MREYKRVILLILIMAVVAGAIGGTAIGILYNVALEQERLRLVETVQSQARLMEAIARFDREYTTFPGGADAATLSQVSDAHEHFRQHGLGETGEFTLARREGDDIVFVLRHRYSDVDKPEPVPFHSGLAEPMRRALSGESGTVIGPDYRGEMVLAAHEPVALLDLGIVAKIDLSEIRAPFFRAIGIVVAIALAVVAAGTVLFFTVSEPILRRIQEGELRFREMFENMNSGAAVYSAEADGSDFIFKDFNRAGERINKIRREELIGRPLTEAFPEVGRFGLLEVLERVWRTGEPERLPAAYYEDHRISGWRTIYAYKLPSGEVVSLFEDVTDRKRAETALQESEERFRSIAESAKDAIVSIDGEGNVISWNRAAEHIFGYTAAEMLGEPLTLLIPERYQEGHRTGLERAVSGGNHHVIGKTVELEGLRKDQTEISVELSLSTWTLAENRFFTGIIRDITERKRTEGDLRKLFQAMEQNPASVVITDVQGRIEYINPKFTETTGYAYAEVFGKNPRIVKSEHTTPEEYETLWRTISAGNVWRGEFHNRKKNGELFWELASIAPVRDARGKITHYVAVKEDITERKETEEQLRQAQKMEVIGQFTGGIAHDFNNLLAIILGNLQLLEESAAADDEDRELIADAIWSAERGAELTHRLLAFARRQRLNPGVTDLNRVIGNMTDLMRRTLGASIQVHEVLAPGLWETMIDRGQLENALLNLVVNARDAMPDGGVLTIATDNAILQPGDVTEVQEFVPGEYAMLAVSDTGTGMPPEVVEHIFEPFFTTKKFGEGSGLGLSMIYGFVRQSGGYIAVDSATDSGTTVKLYLPRASSSGGQSTEVARPAARKAGEGEVILVVDNDNRVRKTAVTLLRKQGYEVFEASTAADALQLVDTLQRLDLLFTDVVLPDGVKGSELAKKVRDRLPETKVLFTSGYAEDALLFGGAADNKSELFPKPYRRGQLADKVRDILDVTKDGDASV